MRLAYVDESYTRDAYFLGALVLDDACRLTLSRALDDVVEQAMAQHPEAKLCRDSELHAHAIFHGKAEWGLLKDKVRARVAVYDHALRVIGEHSARIILCGTERQAADRLATVHDRVSVSLLGRLNYLGHVLGDILSRPNIVDSFRPSI